MHYTILVIIAVAIFSVIANNFCEKSVNSSILIESMVPMTLLFAIFFVIKKYFWCARSEKVQPSTAAKSDTSNGHIEYSPVKLEEAVPANRF